MQDHDWDDLKFLLALHRAGKLSEAGRLTGASETTVARRLRRLESSLGCQLITRNALGNFDVTDTAQSLVAHAEAIEQKNIAIRETVGAASDALVGVVRISSVPIIINRLLVPSLSYFHDNYPALKIELVPESRNVDLSKREADLAIRFDRPVHGGKKPKLRNLRRLGSAHFAQRRCQNATRIPLAGLVMTLPMLVCLRPDGWMP